MHDAPADTEMSERPGTWMCITKEPLVQSLTGILAAISNDLCDSHAVELKLQSHQFLSYMCRDARPCWLTSWFTDHLLWNSHSEFSWDDRTIPVNGCTTPIKDSEGVFNRLLLSCLSASPPVLTAWVWKERHPAPLAVCSCRLQLKCSAASLPCFSPKLAQVCTADLPSQSRQTIDLLCLALLRVLQWRHWFRAKLLISKDISSHEEMTEMIIIFLNQ